MNTVDSEIQQPDAAFDEPRFSQPLALAALLATQFLGAVNDNLFRVIAASVGQRTLGGSHGGTQALAIGGICFTLPYLLLAPLAGSLSDRYSKRNVIVGCKIAEILIFLLGCAAIGWGHPWLLFFVVLLTGAHSALYAPAKYGSIPEILRPESLSTGNGLMGLTTIVGSALGGVLGYQLYGGLEKLIVERTAAVTGPWTGTLLSLGEMQAPSLCLIGFAAAGLCCSLLIPRLSARAPDRRLVFNTLTETVPALRLLAADRRILRTSLGIAFFWALASLAQMNIDPFGNQFLGMPKSDVGLLMAVLVAGVGIGSVLAGLWSDGKVELGIVPLGAMGIVISGLSVYYFGSHVVIGTPILQQPIFFLCAGSLFLLGVSSGLFDIPLESFLQYHSDPTQRATILAGNNFVSSLGIMGACITFKVLRETCGLSAGQVFLAAGLGTIPVLIYVLWLLPDVTFRFFCWVTTKTIYRLRVVGRENIPEHGGAVLVANHISWLDGILVLISSSRFVRFLVYADYTQKPGLRRLSQWMHVIPIKSTEGPRAIVRALQAAKEAVKNGEVVCIFAEGSISRTGELQPFQKGLMKIVEGTHAPVIPVYLEGLWGSIFSHFGGKFFWKWPRRWPYPVSIHFGKPLSDPDNVNQVREAVEQLGIEAGQMAAPQRFIPVRQFIRQCKRARARRKVADSSGTELSGFRLLVASIAMRRALRRVLPTRAAPDCVGVFVPPSVGGVILNAALALDRRVAINLNYTLTDETLNYCVKKANIRYVLTSRMFLMKRPTNLEGVELIYVEDLKAQISKWDQAVGAAMALLPAGLLDRGLGLTALKPDDLLTIVFTSGSTGEPKGVMLSHANIDANVQAVDQMLHLSPQDTLLGILPFFHSFGYTVLMWLPLCCDPAAVYHHNPLDARTVGKLSQKYDVTILLSTPTFLKTYLKRVEPAQFHKLDLVVVGAEKLPQDLAQEFHAKFNVFPSEGYGTTELSPVAAVNIPAHRSSGNEGETARAGTVGRPLAGVAARVVNPDTGVDIGLNQEGLLQIKGPNVMLGYLKEPELTAKAIKDGWYDTGDFARIDNEGFIQITGRKSRFSKIGGEMVPHIKIEEELTRILEAEEQKAIAEQAATAVREGESPAEPPPAETAEKPTEKPSRNEQIAEMKLVVTSVPDASKGERLIILHTGLPCPSDRLIQALSATGVPNLWLPSNSSFYKVDQIPILGTGKLDLQKVKQMAMEHAG